MSYKGVLKGIGTSLARKLKTMVGVTNMNKRYSLQQ
jgi:hypothetical protein